jgi:hypothetical protein
MFHRPAARESPEAYLRMNLPQLPHSCPACEEQIIDLRNLRANPFRLATQPSSQDCYVQSDRLYRTPRVNRFPTRTGNTLEARGGLSSSRAIRSLGLTGTFFHGSPTGTSTKIRFASRYEARTCCICPNTAYCSWLSSFVTATHPRGPHARTVVVARLTPSHSRRASAWPAAPGSPQSREGRRPVRLWAHCMAERG